MQNYRCEKNLKLSQVQKSLQNAKVCLNSEQDFTWEISQLATSKH